jgi:penicillin amidase
MPLDDLSLIAVLRGDRSVQDICAASGATPAEFAAARDAWLARQAAPRDRRVHAAVKGRTEILRDRAGVPHVFASHTPDVYFGLGLAMAEDRLWQMDRLRRRALGRQAEILGAAYVAADLAHLTVGLDVISAREAEAIDPATKALVTSFVAGINRGIETMGADLPIEFRVLGYTPAPFTVRDVIAITRGFWWSLNGRIDRIIAAELSRLLPEHLRTLYLTPEASENLVLPPTAATGGANAAAAAGTDDATGSNNWAISGAKAADGHPILCGDPHQPFWVPASWYEFALHGPEDNSAGCGHAGVPGLWWGSNGIAAWCLTNNAASTRDLYREQVDPADPTRYRDGAEWRSFDSRIERIPVRGDAAREITIRATVRGPVINALVPSIDAAGDPPMSLRWVGMEHIDDLRALIGLGRVTTWEGFRDVLRDWSVAVFNYIYADRAGHIGYQMCGRIPIRGRTWPGVRDAANPEDRWTGYIPFDGLPTRHDPQGGVVASANQRIVGADFPYPIYGAYSQGHRGVRLAEAFAAQPEMDASANITLQNDIKNSRAERTVPFILKALAGNADPASKEVAAILGAWDYQYATETPAPTLFETFMAIWNRLVLGRHLPAHLIDLAQQQTGLAVSVLEGAVPDYFPAGIPATIADVARQSVAALEGRLGHDRAAWNWGRVHIAHWRHPLSGAANTTAFDIGPAPVSGGSHTIRNTGGELPPHTAGSGAEYRIVVDFAAPDSFLAVQNIGNSGIPGSPHYRDQFQPWIDGTYHTVHLTRAGVETDIEATTVIDPG